MINRKIATYCYIVTVILFFVASSSTTTHKTNGFTPNLLLVALQTQARSKRSTVTAVVESNLNTIVPSKYASDDDDDLISRRSPKLIESFTTPVLKHAYLHLLAWKGKYGHPNIPLKNEGGNACQTIRRLHAQKKLISEEVEWLDSIGFKFHSFEDIYRFADFDEMLDRLLSYEEAHPNNNFQVPKKCPEDPELGAWVTGIRRLCKDGAKRIKPDHERRLCEINFAWESTRSCGSKFMTQYRDYLQQVEELGSETVLKHPTTILWIQAQQQALKRGTLSQTRVIYMGTLFGDRWTTIGNEIEKSSDVK